MKLVEINGSTGRSLTIPSKRYQIALNEEGIIVSCDDENDDNKKDKEISSFSIWRRTMDSLLSFPRPVEMTKRVTRISANVYFTVFATGDEIWTYGMNRIDPTSSTLCDEPLLRLVSSGITPRQLTCGYFHVLLVDNTDVSYSFGCGSSGQLGIGECIEWIPTPQRVSFSTAPVAHVSVDSVSAGSYHSAFVLKSGQMYTCGSSSGHRLGLHALSSEQNLVTQDHLPTPSLIEDLEEVGFSFLSHLPCGVQLSSCGVWHTIAVLKETGDVYGWGWSKFGQFGRSHLLICSSLSLSLFVSFFLLWCGFLVTSSSEETYYPSPTRLSILDSWIGDEQVTKVACGSRFTAILTSSSRLIVL
jgi:alpha-tubulin suppressor-like RCC1 family protein